MTERDLSNFSAEKALTPLDSFESHITADGSPVDDGGLAATESATESGTVPIDENPFSSPVLDTDRPTVAPSAVIPLNDSPPCWYCGLAEAAAWWLGTLGVHLTAAIFMAIVLVVFNLLNGKKSPADINEPASMMWITSGEMILFVLAAMLGVSVRYWGRTFHELNFQRPDHRHFWLVLGGTLPLTMCVSVWAVPVQLGWSLIKEAIPVLSVFDSMNSMEAIKDLADASSLGAMVFVVAVLPAIGEELIFRGAIGRVLIANLGMISGVLLTTFLFGCLHIHPVHAVAVMPLGLAIHLVYLWSRSFWLPMLLHFVNNCWATIAAQNQGVDPTGQGLEMPLINLVMMLISAVGVVAMGICFRQSRVRLFDASGNETPAVRFPVRVTSGSGIESRSMPMNGHAWQLAIACMVFCHLIVALDLIKSIGQW